MKRGFVLLSVNIVNVAEGDGVVVGLDVGPAPGDGVVVVPLVQNFVSLPCNRKVQLEIIQEMKKVFLCSIHISIFLLSAICNLTF